MLDVWSDDPRSPNYNRHVVIDPRNPPDSYSHEKCAGGDFAYRWLVRFGTNSDRPCPAMAVRAFSHSSWSKSANPLAVRQWRSRTCAASRVVSARPQHPCYALLTKADYCQNGGSWNLPAPELVELK